MLYVSCASHINDGYEVVDTDDDKGEFYSKEKLQKARQAGVKIKGVFDKSIKPLSDTVFDLNAVCRHITEDSDDWFTLIMDIFPDSKLLKMAKSIYPKDVIDTSFSSNVTFKYGHCWNFVSLAQSKNIKRGKQIYYITLDNYELYLPCKLDTTLDGRFNKAVVEAVEAYNKNLRGRNGMPIYSKAGYNFNRKIETDGSNVYLNGASMPVEKFENILIEEFNESKGSALDSDAQFEEVLPLIIPENIIC